ncbi:hypothetical protein BOX15_Mlig025647g2, partial [Macrostomum lignano]
RSAPSRGATRQAPHLLALPSEILVEILRYLRLADVPAVSATCRHLNSLLHGPGASQGLWRSLHGNGLANDEARKVLPVLQPVFPCDCNVCSAAFPGPVYRDELRAGAAWHRGRPLESTLCNFKPARYQRGGHQRPAVLAMPCLQLHGNQLVYSQENRLYRLRLNAGDRWQRLVATDAYRGSVGAADVTALSVESPADGGRALVGTGDGRLLLWASDGAGPPRRLHGHPFDQSAVNCIDSCSAAAAGFDCWRLVLAGTKGGSLMAARLNGDCCVQDSQQNRGSWRSWNSGDRIYACRLAPDGSGIALIGCAGLTNASSTTAGADSAEGGGPLRLFNVETGAQLAAGQPLTDTGLRRRGSGIRGVAFQSVSLAVTVGYDARVRLWDLRMLGGGVATERHRLPAAVWEDPSDCAGTAVQADRCHTVLVGLMQHGLVRLYDIRQTRSHVRTFYKGAHYPDCVARLTRSPVYSLDFNAHCFVRGLDSEINCVRFA